MKIGEKVLNKKTHEIVMIVGFSEDKQYAALGKTMGDMVVQTGAIPVSDLEKIKDAIIILPKAEEPASVDAQAPVSQSAEEAASKAVQ